MKVDIRQKKQEWFLRVAHSRWSSKTKVGEKLRKERVNLKMKSLFTSVSSKDRDWSPGKNHIFISVVDLPEDLAMAVICSLCFAKGSPYMQLSLNGQFEQHGMQFYRAQGSEIKWTKLLHIRNSAIFLHLTSYLLLEITGHFHLKNTMFLYH